eukprot:TRINITY_DN32771_c0_g1_i1.p2 TRINITY_DN32771_c0_g1~~TRINITY_DN32771_c0_g1_i1.p2  ORF type:complete len:166 (+),score=53.40 TRINITY_DN32771_c0_g1_i1:64-561(+)
MEWVPLAPEMLRDVCEQNDEVVSVLRHLSEKVRHPSTRDGGDAEVLRELVVECQRRVADLEAFYAEHDLEAWAAAVEQQRLKLKREVRGVMDALKAAATAPQPASRYEGQPPPQRPHPRAQAQAPPARPYDTAATTDVVQVRVRLTRAEFEELKSRRRTMCQMLG